MARVRIYEPYGYKEELDYKSRKSKLDSELEKINNNDEKEFSGLTELFDKSFAQVVYDAENTQFLFKNVSGETKGVANMTDIIPSDLVTEAHYDAEAKKIVITFKNGQVVEIPIEDVIDVNEFGDGLEVVSGTVRVKLDSNGETFLTVGEDGIKLDGVQDAIDSAVAVVDEKLDVEFGRAQNAENIIQANLDQESARAVAKEAELTSLITAEASNRAAADDAINTRIDEEIARATSAETALDEKIDGEIARATAAETALDNRTTELETDLQNETVARQNAVSQINANINNINTQLGMLDSRLDSEKDRAQSAENQIASDLAAEIARATAAEASLDEKVSAISASVEDVAVYVGDGKTIEVSEIDANRQKKISATISMLKVTTGLPSNVQEAYQLVDAEGTKIGDQINVYKDSSLLDVALVKSPATWDPTEKKIVGGTGDTVLAFAYQLSDSSEVVITEIPLSELVSDATYKDGLQVNENDEVSVKIDSTSEDFLSVSSGGVKVSGVQTAINTTVDAHANDTSVHTTAAEKAVWNNMISGVSVNGKSVTVTNNKASFTITASSEPITGTPNAIVVNTDDNGNIVIGLAVLDSGGY